MSGPVMAVLDRLAMLATDKGDGYVGGADARQARVAVAELIEKANTVAYAFIDVTGDWHNGFQVNPEDIAALRAALARVGGQP